VARTSRTVHLFAGPSLFGTAYHDAPAGTCADADEVVWLPPARRGDAQALIRAHEQPGVLALADGTFHSYPSIAHQELRDAMQQGWLVYGLCSMGAIRACELAHMGMKPFGRVAQMFCDDPDLPDDEVALVHEQEAPYLPFSEPMVHIREFLAQMEMRGLLTSAQRTALTTSLRERWYAERTLAKLREELSRLVEPTAFEALSQAMADFTPYRLKQQDLVAFVQTKPWLND
jgi:TfuA protein